MAKKVEVVLQANTRQFDRSIQDSENKLGRFSRSGSAGFARMATAIAGVVAAAKTLQGIVTVGAKFQDLQDSLNAVFGSAQKGAQAFDKIKKFSLQTQFGVDTLTNAFIQLKGAGVEPTEELLMTFADTASVTTDQMGTFQAALDLVSRSTAGGLGLEDLNRLADRGIPVFQILQEKLGLARLEVSEFGKSAAGANQIIAALTEGLDERFGGTLQTKLDNVSVKFSNMQIAIQNLAAAMFEKLEPTLVKVIDGLTQGAMDAESFVRSASSLEEVFGNLMTTLEPLVKVLVTFADVFAALIGLKIFRMVIIQLDSMSAQLATFGRRAIRATKSAGILGKFLKGSLIVIIATLVIKIVRTIAVLSQLEGSIGQKLVYAFKHFANEAVGAFLGTLNAVTAIAIKIKDGLIGIFTGQGLDGFRETGKAVSDAFAEGMETGKIFDLPEIVEKAFDEANFLGKLPEDFNDAFEGINDMAFIMENAAEKISNSTVKIGENTKDIVDNLKEIGEEIQTNFLSALSSANKSLSTDLANALLEGKSALDSFKDYFKRLVVQLIADAIRLFVVEKILSSIFGFFVPGSELIFESGKATIKPKGKAMGGPVMANQPYIVGERGPELFVPGQNGGITPNHAMGGTSVNYTINAVDAPSFQALVASDPEFIYNVTRVGAKRLPGAR
jgi:hypothetical protein